MTLEQRLNNVKNQIGLVGGPLHVNKVTDAEHNIRASIDPTDWHIELTLNQDWNPVPDKKTREYAKKKNITDALWVATRDVVYHECGHWALPRGSKDGCPRSSELHDTILDAVVQARTEKGKDRNKQLEHYMANSFEDLLDNTFCKGQTSHAGQVLFYNDQGICAEENRYGAFYEAFVKLNLYAWGDKHDERLLNRFFQNEEKTIDAVKKVIFALELDQKSEELGREYRDTEKLMEHFRDESRWSDIAYQFTTIMEDLMDEQMPQQSLFGVGNPSESGNGEEGQEGQSQGQDGNKKSSGEGKEGKPSKPKDGGSTFDKKLDGDKEKIIVSRFRDGRGKASYMDRFEYLDSLYRSLGRQIPVKVELFKKSHGFPVAHYGQQAFDPEKHDVRRVKLTRLGIDEYGEIGFQTHRGNISIPAQYIKNLRGFPDLKIVNLDTSGSMKEALFGRDTGMVVNPFAPRNQQWGVKSKYHHSLIGKYGIDAYFDMQGISGDADSILINTSSSSIASDRNKTDSRTEENRLALSPQFGMTYMDCDTLEESLGESCFVLSMSDGEFQNWNEQKNTYRELMSNHAYAHIQMGNANTFTNDLQEWGFAVHFVNKENPLEKLMVDVTQKTYQKFAMEAITND